MAIIISKNGKNAKKVEKADFGKEGYLQKYIYENPDSIPLYDIKENVRLLILSREFPTESGPIDAIGIDGDGEIYLVETKLYRNPDKRLVVSQVLDYGASLWSNYRNDFSRFSEILEKEAQKLGMSLEQRLEKFFGIDDQQASQLLGIVKNNLAGGNFKFVVLMDKLQKRLKDLIIFINQNSEFDIFAVELEYYRHEDYEILIPKLYGAQVKKDITPSRAYVNWDEESFFREAETHFRDDKLKDQKIQAIRKLYNFSKERADELGFGRGKKLASFCPVFYNIPTINRRSLYVVQSDGALTVNFDYLETSEFRHELMERLKKAGFHLAVNKKFPVIKIDGWYKTVDKFIEVIVSLLGYQS